jgi:hypothetical protein
MTPSLERLAELVRQAEAKTRARKIETETQQAAEQFRAAELRARRAVERLRTVRPASMRALEQADTDEQVLKDLVRKLAQYKSSLDSDVAAEELIATSQIEIERTRKQARTQLEEVSRDVDEARRELRVALDQYRQLRRELDRLQPELADQFADLDRLLWDAEGHFPGGQLQLLAQEVDAGLGPFAALGKLEQYARLKVWIGRFRFYQATHERDAEMSEELQNLGHRVFHQLKWLSRQYEPGYIEAFRQDYSTDWAAYVAEAQEQLVQAIEASRRGRDGESSRSRDRDRDREHNHATERTTPAAQPPRAAPAGVAVSPVLSRPSSLTQLRLFLTRVRLPDELDRFLEIVRQTVDELGPNNPHLMALIYPYRRHLAGDSELESLRHNLDQIHQNKQTPATSRQDENESEDYGQNGDDGENEDSDDDS